MSKKDRILAAPPTSWVKVEAKARRLLSEVCPECVDSPTAVPLIALFEGGLRESSAGFDYDVRELHGDEALFDSVQNTIVLDIKTYEGLVEDNGRDRFTLGHEIGHGVLHRPYMTGMMRDNSKAIYLRRSEVPPYQNLEIQANVFASEFLMPSKHVYEMLLNGACVEDVVSKFQVSYSAAEVKVSRIRKEKGLQPTLKAFF